MVDAIELIHQDHLNLDKVLSVLLEVGGNLPEKKSTSKLTVLRDALYYIEVFPERFHHPKEESILFPFVRKHRPDLGQILDELHQQHEDGSKVIGALAARLKDLENDWTSNRVAFESELQAYIEAQRQHMSLEEREILKPIKQSLSRIDIKSINSAYGVSVDPLFGDNLSTGFNALLNRITRLGERESVTNKST
ncbi:MAG: hemerythrin [marine bacterium B5-7]|nr:MAG: hemerythrin [marine bacterium B5-7]